jgi:hypothetical protein
MVQIVLQRLHLLQKERLHLLQKERLHLLQKEGLHRKAVARPEALLSS